MSKYFTLDEFTRSQIASRLGIDNTPRGQILVNLERIMATMDQVRDFLRVPVLVSSGYRCPALNKAAHGAVTSAHMRGLACDFRAPTYGDPLVVARALEKSGIAFDQLIHEFDSWVHIGLTEEQPRREVLTIDSQGTRRGLF